MLPLAGSSATGFKSVERAWRAARRASSSEEAAAGGSADSTDPSERCGLNAEAVVPPPIAGLPVAAAEGLAGLAAPPSSGMLEEMVERRFRAFESSDVTPMPGPRIMDSGRVGVAAVEVGVAGAAVGDMGVGGVAARGLLGGFAPSGLDAMDVD